MTVELGDNNVDLPNCTTIFKSSAKQKGFVSYPTNYDIDKASKHLTEMVYMLADVAGLLDKDRRNYHKRMAKNIGVLLMTMGCSSIELPSEDSLVNEDNTIQRSEPV